MAQMTLRLRVGLAWWAWPLVYVVAWSAYPVLLFCSDATLDRFVSEVVNFVARHGLRVSID